MIKGVFGGEKGWNPSTESLLWLYSRRVKLSEAVMPVLDRCSNTDFWNERRSLHKVTQPSCCRAGLESGSFCSPSRANRFPFSKPIAPVLEIAFA